MTTLRSPKKKVKQTTKKQSAATAKPKTAAKAKPKPAVKAKPKTAAPTKKKPAVTAKPKSVPKTRQKSAAPTGPAVDIGVVAGSQAAFERYLPQARALPAEQVTTMRFDPELAYFNVRIGVAALLPHRSTLTLDLPRVDLGSLFALPELCQALLFATSQAALGSAGTGPSLKELIGEGQDLRGKLLVAADSLAKFKLISASTVAKIRKGRGNLDTAKDLGDLAALHASHLTAFSEKTPVTPAQAQRAAELGSLLLARLSPSSARRVVRPAMKSQAVTDRDRLAVLLVRGHRDLRRVAYWVWGDEFDQHVPALLSRARPRKKPAPPEAPVPAAG